MFVNRSQELATLEASWAGSGPRLGLVWGRRRIGKTTLLRRFARDHRSIFHVGASRPPEAELRQLSQHAAATLTGLRRDLSRRPFVSWDDAFEVFGEAARNEPLLIVLDEFPELMAAAPELPSILRAVWEGMHDSQLRVILCGSEVRTMESLQETRAPLFGRFDVALLVHPFRPHEVGAMLPALSPADQALVWGLVGGTPLYLSWWDQNATVSENLSRLVTNPSGRLYTEGQHLIDTEADSGGLGRRVLYAVGDGRTKHNEIADAVNADPTRTLDRLVELRLLERMVPVTDDPRRTRRRVYRIADNFLAFWFGMIDRQRTEIELGLGDALLPSLLAGVDDLLGAPFEDAARLHLRRMASNGLLGPDVVAVGSAWQDNVAQIDALVLSGRDRHVTLAAEVKWSRVVSGARLARELDRKLDALKLRPDGFDIPLAVIARERVEAADGLLALTAADLFGDEAG